MPAQFQQGPVKNDSLTFDFESTFDEGYAADYYQLEITVPEGATVSRCRDGLSQG